LATIKYILNTEEHLDYQTAMQTVLGSINLDKGNRTRHVLVAHGVVAAVHDNDDTVPDMPERCDSERELTIGGTEFWTSDLLAGFDYVALGHLHSCQKSGSERIRYAGSPMKYSFSEEHHTKGLLQIDLDGDGNITVEQLVLTPLYDMRTIRGELAELLQPEVVQSANHMDYIRAILTDYGELLEPMARLREQYPNVLLLEREQQMIAEPIAEYTRGNIHIDQPEQLFTQFYRQVTGSDMTDMETDIIAHCFRTVREEE
jgi:exonuclease SbcD